MSKPEQMPRRVSQWCYEGVWSIITKYLRVPSVPPMPVGADDQDVQCFRPAEGYLRYLKFQFWLLLLIIDLGLVIAWIALVFTAPPWLSLILTIPIWVLIIAPDIIAYIALHLSYDTTWYAISDRSLRIRRGIWVIHETTITYENIQNVTVNQGPLQRYFGISDVQVETAGGAGGAAGQSSIGHQGTLAGIDCPEEIRRLILLKWKQSKATGLGDEHDRLSPVQTSTQFNSQQLNLLEQIRDLSVELAN